MKTIKILILLMVLACGELFANSIATITAIKGSATVQRVSGDIEAILGTKLEEKDTVITKNSTKVQIIFKDNTIISIGKNSNFSIEEYLFDDEKEPVARFGLLKGAMRTITGKIGKIAPEKFSVVTKTATIGIRGTNFSVLVGEDGSYNAYCTYGAIDVSVHGETYLVKQDFFLNVSPAGKINVKEFSPIELKNMQQNHLISKGQTKDITAKAVEFMASNNNKIPIDITKTNYNGVAVVGAIETLVLPIQKEDSPKLALNQSLITTPESIKTETLTTPDIVVDDETASITDDIVTDDETASITDDTVVDDETTSDETASTAVLMQGISTNSHEEYADIQKLNLSFNKDGSYFDSSNSWLENVIIDSSHESSKWRFTIADTPVRYSTKEDFETTFSSVEVMSGSDTSPTIMQSSFIATNDDLAHDDYMSWGKWNAKVSNDNMNYGKKTDDTQELGGLWVAGEPTNEDLVSSLVGVADYSGIYRAKHEGNIVNGSANMNIDFGKTENQVSLNIDKSSSIPKTNYIMSIAGNSMSGSDTNNIKSQADGTFYGPNADAVGGNFNIYNKSDKYYPTKGVYQVKK